MPRDRGVNRELRYHPAGELRKTWPDREDLTDESAVDTGTTGEPTTPTTPTEEDGPATPDTP